ncbi:Isopentenyl-diphosphate Delta-isomerase [hydrothermal vent metagenome]|uniref:isopentenyl-diphosphate Delta-isomerase n=1 Tax=hydrothermal vent metagenome TaxID=652676 RepID=A0A3B0UAH8_9ZZZZ
MADVILVNSKDFPIGTMEKLEAHQKGKLHRAYSVFLFNNQQELLLQKRAATKYHSANLWSNTCCSHPAPGEHLTTSAQNRLLNEMGITTSLQSLFSFTYKTEFENGLIEHELDHVLIGKFNASPLPNPAEASDWKYASFKEVSNGIKLNPEHYTFWFKEIYKRVFKFILSN